MWENYFGRCKNECAKHASSSIMEREEFILPDWSPPDDPARVLVAEGRLSPSLDNEDWWGDKTWQTKKIKKFPQRVLLLRSSCQVSPFWFHSHLKDQLVSWHSKQTSIGLAWVFFLKDPMRSNASSLRATTTPSFNEEGVTAFTLRFHSFSLLFNSIIF